MRNLEGKGNRLLCLLIMVPLGHGFVGSLPALAECLAVLKDTCGPQEQWRCMLPACLTSARQGMGSQASRLLRAWQIPHLHPE